MKKAWIENGLVRDVCPGDPSALYHPDVADHYNVSVPDNAESGDCWNGTLLEKHVPTSCPSADMPPKVSPVQFLLLFTPAERVAIKSHRSSDAMIDDFLSIVEDPRLTMVDLGLQSTVDGLGYLVSQGLITSARMSEILIGVVK